MNRDSCVSCRNDVTTTYRKLKKRRNNNEEKKKLLQRVMGPFHSMKGERRKICKVEQESYIKADEH